MILNFTQKLQKRLLQKSLLSVSLSTALTFMTITVKAQETTKWPDLPLLNIETVDHVMPTATRVDPPEGCWAPSVVSEHVSGRLVITEKDNIVYNSGDYEKGESGIRIKIRGNGSALYFQQKPYKLKLSKKADLFNLDKSYKSKDWALLGMAGASKVMPDNEINLLINMGHAVCRALDFPWTPTVRFVNVVLNGKYVGIYNLIETIERADNRVVTGKSGFLIENDAYWWKEGDHYFKTDRQIYPMGYTFKYPDEPDEEQIAPIREYMNTVEKAVFARDNVADYIDYESFARWILAHDILGTTDAGGSNMYLYKEMLNEEEPSDSKLKMATPWDFDTVFQAENNKWSNIHNDVVFFYPELFKDKKFVDVYKELFNKYRYIVYDKVSAYFSHLQEECGEAFDESRLLHQKVYPSQCLNPIGVQIDGILSQLNARLVSLDAMVDAMHGVEDCVGNVGMGNARLLKRTNLYGVDFTDIKWGNLQSGIYVEKYSDGQAKKVIK